MGVIILAFLSHMAEKMDHLAASKHLEMSKQVNCDHI